MRYFVDTEHTDDGERFELISIAIVGEDGREYDAAVDGYDPSAGYAVDGGARAAEGCHLWVTRSGSSAGRSATT